MLVIQMVIKMAKWSLFDSACKDSVQLLRFDKLAGMIASGEIHRTDLIRSPHDVLFIPVKFCQPVAYYNLKRKQSLKMHPEEKEEEFMINERIFIDGHSSSKKYDLFKKFSQKISLLLVEEVILYVIAPLRQKTEKTGNLVVFTDKRVLRLSFNRKGKYLTDIKVLPYKKIKHFLCKEDSSQKIYLEVYTVSGETLQWRGLSKVEIEKINMFLSSYMCFQQETDETLFPEPADVCEFQEDDEEEAVCEAPALDKEKKKGHSGLLPEFFLSRLLLTKHPHP